jgi:integrase
MALIKRGQTWWIEFTTARGRRVRCSAFTEDKTAAQELHDKLKAESWREELLNERPKRTWDEAALRWLNETEYKRSHQTDVYHIQWLQQHFRGKLLNELTREHIARVAETKRQDTSPTTANRILALVRAIMNRAAGEWEWIDKAPFIRLYPEPRNRVRWLKPEEAHALLKELPDYMADMTRFALATGLRRGNVLGLEWSQVDLPRKVAWIHGDQAKAGKDIHVTLNNTAIAVLEKQIGKHPTQVFTYRGQPIRHFHKTQWNAALERAGIQNFRWHDLRHTWASWLAQDGVPMNVLMEMGGWHDTTMVLRYAHLAPERFTGHASVVDRRLNDTNLPQAV